MYMYMWIYKNIELYNLAVKMALKNEHKIKLKYK